MFKISQRVQVSGEAGTVIGRIEEIRTIDELPEVPAGVFGDFAPTAVLRGLGVERVAYISYHASAEQQLIFAALEIRGEWFDLRHQKLELEIVGVCS